MQAITQELKSLQSQLAKQNKDASVQRQALQKVESQIGQLRKDIVWLDHRIEKTDKELAELSVQRVQLEQQQQEKKQEIDEILRLAYKQNNVPLLKLILSGQRPEELSRQLYYFSALTDNQQSQLYSWLADQEKLDATIHRQEVQRSQLTEDQEALVEQKTALTQQQQRREQVIASLTKQSADTEAEIRRKESERKKMAELIAQLQARLDAMSLEFPSLQAIRKVKGKLPWPVAGRLVNSYGRSIEGSSLKWQGWLIAASSGTAVKAVHGGRVVFADFFKSTGLLIIVDHGDGVWTLYGRNQTLLRDVGSWVEAGETIAEVGQSGGYSESGLYFEIRLNGEPTNPSGWLKKGQVSL